MLVFLYNFFTMNYLIIGTGGVGGCIAGFLALAGKDVTCIAAESTWKLSAGRAAPEVGLKGSISSA